MECAANRKILSQLKHPCFYLIYSDLFIVFTVKFKEHVFIIEQEIRNFHIKLSWNCIYAAIHLIHHTS